jgi:uncharacterized membrane protein (DUF106 family)
MAALLTTISSVLAPSFSAAPPKAFVTSAGAIVGFYAAIESKRFPASLA